MLRKKTKKHFFYVNKAARDFLYYVSRPRSDGVILEIIIHNI